MIFAIRASPLYASFPGQFVGVTCHTHPHWQRTESHSLSFFKSALHKAHERIHIALPPHSFTNRWKATWLLLAPRAAGDNRQSSRWSPLCFSERSIFAAPLPAPQCSTPKTGCKRARYFETRSISTVDPAEITARFASISLCSTGMRSSKANITTPWANA